MRSKFICLCLCALACLLLTAAASLGIVALVWRGAERLGRDPVAPALFVGLSPLVLVHVVAAAHNERELRQDPTAHAEMIALREAAQAFGSWRLLGAELFVTLEPCCMCAGAAVLARVQRVVYGAADPKAGACGSVLDVVGEPQLNHRPKLSGGVLEAECGQTLSVFFASRR